MRGSSIMYVISLRTNARNSSSIALSSRTICAAATVSRRANASSARRRIDTAISPDNLISAILTVRDAPSSIDALGALGDFLGFVAGALEIRDGLRDRDQQAQVARGRLTARDDVAALLVDLDFHRVQALLRRRSPARRCRGRTSLSACIALTICDSTRPPISSTFEDTAFRSASNWLDRCLSDMSCSA